MKLWNMNTKEIFFKCFVGTWNVARIIGKNIKAFGTAKFSLKNEDVVMYREEIKITVDDKITEAYQEYLYKYEDGKIFKCFSDGREFYELIIEEKNAYGQYLCSEDLYKAFYTFDSPNYFTLNYKIKGPAKDYVIENTFFRDVDVKQLGNVDNFDNE
jgi:hypothetical protein